MHPLLARQLKRALGELPADIPSLPRPWNDFVDAVNNAYEADAVDRKLVEHSMETASLELFERNELLTRKNKALAAAEQDIRRSHNEL